MEEVSTNKSSGRSPRMAAFHRVAKDGRLRRALLALLGFSIAEYATWVAVLVYAYRVGGVTLVGVVGAVQLVPAAIFAPVLATIPDRIPRTQALTIGYASQAVSAGFTGWAMLANAQPVITFGLAALTATLITATRPAHNSLIPELARMPNQVTAANVVSTTIEGLGSFGGPALAGVIMGLASPGTAFLFMGGVLMISAISVATLPVRAITGASNPTEVATAGTLAGFKHLAGHKSARLVVGLSGLSQAIAGALDVLVVALAVEYLALGEDGAGYLYALLGAGGVIGGLSAAGLVGRPRLATPLLTAAITRGAPLALVGLFPNAAVAMAASGVGSSLGDVTTRTMLQRLVPHEVMGRLFGIMEGLASAGLAVGAITAPLLVSKLGIRGALIGVGLVLPLVAIIRIGPLHRADQQTRVATAELEILQGAETFAALEPPVLEAIALGSQLEDVPAGEVIVREGEIGDRMWVIAHGTVEVSRQGRVMATLGPGEYFGEIALLSNLPRIATVISLEPVRLLAVTRESFLAAVTGMHGVGIDRLAEERAREAFEE